MPTTDLPKMNIGDMAEGAMALYSWTNTQMSYVAIVELMHTSPRCGCVVVVDVTKYLLPALNAMHNQYRVLPPSSMVWEWRGFKV